MEQLIDSKKNKTFFTRYSKALMSSLYCLLDYQEVTTFTYSMFLIVEFVQLMSFVVSVNMSSFSDSSLMSSIRSLLEWTVLAPQFWETLKEVQVQLCIICGVGLLEILLFSVVALKMIHKGSRNKHSGKMIPTIPKWVFTGFNYLIIFTLTAGFLPIMSMCLYGYKCRSDIVACDSTNHYINCALATFNIFIFFFESVLFSTVVCEHAPKRENVMSKIIPTFDFIDYALKLAICLIDIHIDSKYVLTLVLFVYATYVARKPDRYHSKLVSFIQRVISFLLLSAIILAICTEALSIKISYIFSVFVIWMPILFWCLFSMYYKFYKLTGESINKLLTSFQLDKDENEVIVALYQFHYITNNGNDRDSKICLEGYIKLHEEQCKNTSNCGLCYFALQRKESKKVKISGFTQKETKFLNVFKKVLIRNALKRFPNSMGLKLAYLVLANSKERKDKSYVKKMSASCGTNWILKFALARYQAKNKKKKSFMEQMKTEKQTIIDVAAMLNRFWEILEEESVDVGKVYITGKKAFEGMELLKKIEKERSDKGLEDCIGTYRLYRQFMQSVFLETTEINTRAHTVNQKHNEERAWIRFSTRVKTMGLIMGCNNAFSKLFGYPKSDLIGKHISILIPKLYLKTEHKVKQFMYDLYWKTKEENPNINFAMFGKHKCDYVFPVRVNVDKFSSIFKGPDMIISVDIEKKNFHPRVLYFLTDKDLVIESFSSSFFSLINQKDYNKFDAIKITAYLSEIGKKGWEETYCAKEGNSTILDTKKEEFNIYKVECRGVKIEVDKELFGYSFRLETENEEIHSPSRANVSSFSSNGSEAEIQFEYNIDYNAFIIKSEQCKKETKAGRSSLFYHQGSKLRNSVASPRVRNDLTPQSTSYFYTRVLLSVSSGPYASQLREIYEDILSNSILKNYGKNVKMYRLIDGEQYEIDEQNSCLIEEAFSGNGDANTRTKKEDDYIADSAMVAKKIPSREQLVNKMKESTSRTGARKLMCAVIFSSLILITIFVLEYVLTSQQRSEADYVTSVAIHTFEIIVSMNRFLLVIHQILFAKKGVYYPYPDEATLITETQNEFNGLIDSVSNIEANYYLSLEKYGDQFTIVYPYIYENDEIKLVYSYNETVNLLIGDMIQIAADGYSAISLNNTYVSRFRNLVIGNFTTIATKFSEYSLYEIHKYNNDKKDTVEAIYIASAFVIVLATLIIIPFLIRSTKEGRYIINQLLHVQKKVILTIKDGLAEISNGGGGLSKVEDQENKSLEQAIAEMMRFSKRAKRNTREYSDKLFYVSYYFIPLVAVLAVFEGIALGRYFLFMNYTTGLNDVLIYLKSTLQVPSICLMSLLFQNELFLSSTNTTLFYDTLNSSITYLHTPLDFLKDANKFSISSDRMKNLISVETGNVCNLLGNSKAFNVKCTSDLSDIVSQGLDVSITEYTRLLKKQLQLYVQIGPQNDVLNSKERFMLLDLLELIILPAYNYKEKIVLDELSSAYDYKVSSKNAFFSGAIVSIFLIYGLVWIPIILYIRKKIHVTGCLLGLIPHVAAISNPRIVSFLEERLGITRG